MDYSSAFSGVENAKALNGYTPRLVNGNHTLLLKRFNLKFSQKDNSKIVEADFLVLESDTEKVDSTKGWVWFIGAAGWTGTYAESHLKQFLETVAASIGDTSPIKDLAGAMASPGQAGRGLVLKANVFDGKAKKGGAPGHYQEIKWVPVAQTLEEIGQARAALDAKEPAMTPVAQVAPPPQAAQTQAAKPTGGVSSLLANLKR